MYSIKADWQKTVAIYRGQGPLYRDAVLGGVALLSIAKCVSYLLHSQLKYGFIAMAVGVLSIVVSPRKSYVVASV